MSNCVLFTASTYSHIRSFHIPYLCALQQDGWEVHIACGGPIPSDSPADRSFPIPFEKRMSSPSNFRAQRTLRELMKEHQYQLVITHTSLAAFFTRRAAASLSSRPPVINMVHGYLFDDSTPALKRSVLLAAEKLTAPQTDLLLTMNSYDLQAAGKYRLGARVETVPGIGVDFSRLERPADGRGLPRSAYGLHPDDYVLLYAAEFSARKNQEMLIRALPGLPRQVKLLLPGQGALLEQCQTLADALGVSDRAIFPGFIPDMAPLYALADAAVSSSRSEGLPFNIMEAMYTRLPVVASRVKGHTDLITEEQTGLLYPYGDIAAFQTQVHRLLDDPDLGPALGLAAHEAVLPYGLERVLPQVMEKYRSLLPVGRIPALSPR